MDMKEILKSELRQIIKEEIAGVLSEKFYIKMKDKDLYYGKLTGSGERYGFVKKKHLKRKSDYVFFDDRKDAQKVIDQILKNSQSGRGSDDFEIVSESILKEAANKQVAQEIMKQLGNKTFVMIGAKNHTFGEEKGKTYLGFKIGRNAKGVNYIKIFYDSGKDLYDMEFGAIRKSVYKVKSKESGIYAEDLNKMIEKHTGMYTRL